MQFWGVWVGILCTPKNTKNTVKKNFLLWFYLICLELAQRNHFTPLRPKVNNYTFGRRDYLEPIKCGFHTLEPIKCGFHTLEPIKCGFHTLEPIKCGFHTLKVNKVLTCFPIMDLCIGPTHLCIGPGYS